MDIERHVCSLELSKKLKDLGFPQESAFYWVKDFDINCEYTGEDPIVEHISWLEHFEMEKAIIASAYLASELGEWLKSYNRLPTYVQSLDAFAYGHIEDSSEANIRAKTLVWLVEKGFLDPKSLS